MWSTVYVNNRQSRWKPKTSTLEHDQLQNDSTASCVIAQQYSYVTFVSMRFNSRQKKNRCCFHKCYYFIFFFFNFVSLKLCTLKLRSQWLYLTFITGHSFFISRDINFPENSLQTSYLPPDPLFARNAFWYQQPLWHTCNEGGFCNGARYLSGCREACFNILAQ
jgi:hypothetical protein